MPPVPGSVFPALTPSGRRRFLLFTLCLIANLPILILVAQDPARAVPPGDPPGYAVLASNILRTGTFSNSGSEPYAPEIFRTPGYPVFLAILFAVSGYSLLAIVIAQALLHAACGVMLSDLSERLTGSTAAGWMAGILWMIAPIPILFTGMLFTEILFTFLMLCGVMQLRHLSIRRAAVAGLFLGSAILVRPIGLLLLMTLLPAAFWRAGMWKGALRALVFLSVSIAIISPWLIRNQKLMGKPLLSSVNDVNLFYYTASSCLAHRAGVSLEAGRALALQELYPGFTSGQVPMDWIDQYPQALSDAAIRILMRFPLECGWYNLVDSMNSFRPGVSYTIQFLAPQKLETEIRDPKELSPAMGALADPLVLAIAWMLSGFYIILYLLAAVGFFGLRGRKLEAILFWILPMFMLFYAPGLAGNARFRIPVEPGFCVLASAILIQAAPIWKRFRQSVPEKTKKVT